VISAGWQPAVTRNADGTSNDVPSFDGNPKIFWLRGYVEIGLCVSVAQGAACAFNFGDKMGNTPIVYTAGEEIPEKGSRATVTGGDLACNQH
jgi:hypothetical protein